jgi:hypothetical protein
VKSRILERLSGPKQALVLLVALLAAAPASARIVSIDIASTTLAFGGREFGTVGAYEVVRAIARYEVDPRLPLNAMLVNVEHAPRNARGRVEFDADIVILKPRDLSRGNGRLIYEPVNRGRWLSLDLFNEAGSQAADLVSEAAAGNGFLMRRGYTLVFGGWQPAYPGPAAPGMGVATGSLLAPGAALLTARLPVARSGNGVGLTGRTTENLRVTGAGPTFIGYLAYPAVVTAGNGELRVRRRSTDPAVQPDGLSWKLLDEWRVEITQPTDAAYDAASVYEFSYEAKDPVVYGLALASMRDLVSYLRYEDQDARGQPNPLLLAGQPVISKALGFGASQTGRTVKNLIHHFNADEQGRQVFDGVHIHISGASLNSQNQMFGRPGEKGDDAFPFTYATLFDPVSRRTDGWLARCQAEGNCPKIIHTDSENEVWTAGGLLYTDTQGRDIGFPANVRTYLFASTQHGPASSLERGMCQQMLNPLDYRPSMRALMAALDEWVTSGREPPASHYPTVASGTLVESARASTGFPAIPGVTYNDRAPRPALLASGPFAERLREYPGLVPLVDADGNTRAGIRMPELQVPVATFTGWNLRAEGFGKDEFCVASGSFIPFATSRAERMASKDPRPSLQERYRSRSAYLGAVREAIDRMIAERLLLAEDADPIHKRAEKLGAALR